MAQHFQVHPDNPQPRLIRQAAAILRAGGVIVYPTDSCYALGCRIGDKEAEDQIRAIRRVGPEHHFTLVCRDLSEIATYARVDNCQFRYLKAATPGSYTFILQASREVPRRLQHPKRSTIGLRIPQHGVVRALLEELAAPILSATLILPGEDRPLNEPEDIRERLDKHVALILDSGSCGVEPTTVIDLTTDMPQVLRKGKGSLVPFGLEH